MERALKLAKGKLREGETPLVYGLPGASKALFLKELLPLVSPSFILVPSEGMAEAFTQDLKRLGVKALYLPSWDVAPLDLSSPLALFQYRRLKALLSLLSEHYEFIVLTPQSFLQKSIPPEVLIELAVEFKRGGEISYEELPKKLVAMGYRRVGAEPEEGEFSLKGDFLHIITPDSEEIRVELFGNEVERITLNGSQVESFALAPMLELPQDEELLKDKLPPELLERHLLLGELSGAERLLPKVFELKPITEYVGNLNAVMIEPEQVRLQSEAFVSQVRENYELLKREGLASSRPEEFVSKELPKEKLLIYERQVNRAINAGVSPLPPIDSLSDRELLELLDSLCGYERLVVYQSETFKEIAQRAGVKAVKGLSTGGFKSDSPKRVAWLTEESLLLEKPKREDVASLEVGELVVHRDYGIGIFRGITSREIGGKRFDFIEIEYAGGERLYAPMTQVDRIYRYSGYRGKNPKLDRLGGTSWKNLERRIKASLANFARELAKLYKERREAKGERLVGDKALLEAFAARFPYKLTPDQSRAIREIFKDMESERPMDRLLCGDVGFGKTEVAMRAAMKAVSSGKQVALIAPTTVLVDQHYRTFKERFKDFPVRIEALSRFKTPKEQKEIISRLARGEIDIVIGTHRLVQDDVKFKDLGLLIIDEEHKFGVKTKEKLTKLKSNIDVLYLSATPIPRTLHSALSGFRDISLIETPPTGRRGVKVIVGKYSDETLKSAIERELARGGQVFVVQNDIEELPFLKEKVLSLVPEAKVEIVHGQMKPSQIEKIMHSFFEGEINVLVSTSIVESGLDVPSANTLIVIGAERFGLSQLYQLRGRVGRGVEKGYCYLLTSPKVKLTPEAVKRLEAMKKLSPLGGGFQLALKDLEIRGAGTLLGPKQSGFVESVGLELYTKLFKEVLEEREESDVELNLPFEAFIPDDFVEDKREKLKLYSELISSARPEELMEELRRIKGELPDPMVNLFKTIELKAKARQLGVKEITTLPSGRTIISFREEASVEPKKLVEFVKKRGATFTPEGKLYTEASSLDELIRILEELKESEDEKSGTHS